MRIGIDAMGGDSAPVEEIRGALSARALLDEGDRIVLVGREELLREHLNETDGWERFIEVHPADEVIGMDESPVEALRSKPNSSIALLLELHKRGELDACISAGNTGAFVASAQMRLRRLRGVHRPGIAIVTPTYSGPVALCDVGANVQCRPQHLHQYALMASIYLNALCGIDKPRVGLLSVGEEDTKGNELVKKARDLIRKDPNIELVGNVEGRDLFHGVCDVMVCDGFVGNVVLKLMEGMAGGVIRGMIGELTAAMPDHQQNIRKAAQSIIDKYDFNEYGGAPLLGVAGICIICHGASDHRGFKNAVRVARDFAQQKVNDRITDLLSKDRRTAHA
ncbi:MAG: phosphate acyltransferase PlsX [Phycisphaerae bacterium]